MSRMIAILLSGLIISGCLKSMIEREVTEIGRSQQKVHLRDGAVVKAHCPDGRVYLFSSWQVVDSLRWLEGTATVFDINRDTISTGPVRVPYDSIALIESNTEAPSRMTPLAGLTVLTGVTIAGAIYCISNPKACFGSCPTFYAWDGNEWALQAEGFSASIAPALERTDVDPISPRIPREPTLILQVRNEAAETQVLRSVRLLVVPHLQGERVFKTPDEGFLRAQLVGSLQRAKAESGDLTRTLQEADGVEYLGYADSTGLASKELLEMEFADVPDGPLGLVVTHRQSLMTTFLLYQTLAYMGSSAGYWLAELGRGGGEAAARAEGCGEILGSIDVCVSSGGGWVLEGSVGETGPIAMEETVVPLPHALSHRGTLRLAIRMTRGYWKIDRVALARLVGPAAVHAVGTPLATSLGNDELPPGAMWDFARGPLVLLPGDVYALSFEHNQSGEYEMFLESRGYYLEWMRKEWMLEEDPAMVAQVLFDPERYLRDLAPAYKRAEASMEEAFWNSRVRRIP